MNLIYFNFLALNYHTSRTISTNTVNFNEAVPTLATTPSTTIATTTRAALAGTAYGTYKQGSLSLAWTSTENFIDFTITTKVSGSSNIYSSIGFSNDQKMVN